MKYAIGYDVGVGSLGWAVVLIDAQREVEDVLDIGVRIFSTAREPDKPGKLGNPLAAVRREKRGIRKRTDRLKMRRKATMKQLVIYGLMPQETSEQKALEQLNPLELRAKGVTEKLSLYELGRALFHLQQRRGYASNRRDGANDEAQGMIKAGENLEQLLAQHYQTFGQYLYKRQQEEGFSRFRILPDEWTQAKKSEKKKEEDRKNGKEPIVLYYPTRDAVNAEFNTLWEMQQYYYPEQLTQEAREAIEKAIFYQRDLKPQPRGKCLFYENEDRAPTALPIAQRFRILQKLHDIKIIGADHAYEGTNLSVERKQRLYEKLLEQGNQTESQLKKLLELKGTDSINHFRGSNEKLLGDETAVKMRTSYGKEWDKLTLATQDRIISLLTDCENLKLPNGKERLLEQEDIVQRLMESYGCTEEQAEAMNKTKLGVKMSSFSAKFLQELVPLMEPLQNNLSYSEAVAMLRKHHSRNFTGEIFEELPYYGEVLGNHCIKMPSIATSEGLVLVV